MTVVTLREVYPNASVVLVVLEVRHPTVGKVAAARQAALKSMLLKDLPLFRPATLATVRTVPGGQPEVSTEQVPRYSSRDRTTAVTFGTESLVVETTSYERFERFREVIALAVEARSAVDQVDGVERIGLRYVDEIRVPDISAGGGPWAAWLHPTLLGPAPIGAELDLKVGQWQGVVIFEGARGHGVIVRYGPREGYAVDPGGDLKRPTPLPGPFFLMDIDSFWTPPDEIPEFEPSIILSLTDKLHEPVGRLFESLITDRLRDEVLRHAE